MFWKKKPTAVKRTKRPSTTKKTMKAKKPPVIKKTTDVKTVTKKTPSKRPSSSKPTKPKEDTRILTAEGFRRLLKNKSLGK